jgi:predicted Zn-dependent protease
VDALKNAEKQLQTEPNNGMAHLIAGVLYARKGTPKIALEHLEPAAKEFPNDPQVQMTFARLLTRSGNYDKAEQTLKAILVKNKAFAEPLYLLGFIALRRPDTPENRQNAEKQLRAALELEPTYPEANFELAKLMMRLGRYQDALPFSEKAATNRKHYPAAWQQLTQIYEKLGRASDAERARKLFAAQSERIARERTLLRRYSADPNNVANLLELVDTELALEKMNEASMFMQDVMRIAPNDPRVQEFIKKKNAEMEAQQKSQPGGAEGAASPGGQALPENAPPIGGMPPSGAMPPGRTRPPSSNASPSIAPPAGGGVPSLNNAPPR